MGLPLLRGAGAPVAKSTDRSPLEAHPPSLRSAAVVLVNVGVVWKPQLLAAVNALRDGERLVIACRYFLDLSEEETAAALGIRRGTVKSRTSRALDRLRERLGETYA